MTKHLPDTNSLASVSDFMKFEDRGSPVTVFAFAGAARKIGSLQPYEFRYLFRMHQGDYNLVFLRDVHRSWYHVRPDGSPGGLDFYAEQIEAIKAKLGSTHHVALGVSMGAAAALYFGARCGMDRVIGFSPGFPVRNLRNWWIVVARWANLRALLLSPSGYLWSALLAPIGVTLYARLAQVVGRDSISDMLEAYRREGPLPEAVMYYSSLCYSDVWNAGFLKGCRSVRVEALPTANHNSAGYLMERDELFQTINAFVSHPYPEGGLDAGVADAALPKIGAFRPTVVD